MEFAEKPKEEQMKDWSNKEYLPSADTKLACEFVRMENTAQPVEEKKDSSPVKEEVPSLVQNTKKVI